MMKQVQDMQAKMSDMQNRLGDVEISGQSGGGMITVTMNGKAEMRKIIIDPKLINPEDKEMLEDLAILTGGTVISDEKGMKLENCELEMLGRARRVISTKENTTIVEGKGGKDEIEKRIGSIKKQISEATSDFDKGAIQKAHDAHHTIILIDGRKLVDLMHQYIVGVQIKAIYEVKIIDDDFFEGE